MDSGGAALIGAVVGSATSIGTTWFSEYLRNRRSTKLENICKACLLRYLRDPKYKWRSIQMLSGAIGADEETASGLLLQIGARRSLTGTEFLGTYRKEPIPRRTIFKLGHYRPPKAALRALDNKILSKQTAAVAIDGSLRSAGDILKIVIARSEATKQSRRAPPRWIASLRSQ